MPVVRSQIVHVGFGASHLLDRHPVCGKTVHGHFYTVAVTFNGVVPPDNWGELLTPDQWSTVVAIMRELAFRDLNLMIPAGPPSANGVANYLLERLTMHGATKVEVHESDTDITGVAERT